MARQYNIKWSDKDERELRRVVKNFNAKVNRLQKDQPSLADIRPDKITYQDIKNKVQTRQDLNRELNKTTRFSRRGSEEVRVTQGGAVTTQYQFKEAVIMQRVVTAKRREKRKGIDSFQQVEAESLIDKPKVGTIGQRGFKRFVEALEKETLSRFDEEKLIQYKINYIATAREELGVYSGDVISYVNSLDLDTFVKASIGNPFLRIDFLYTEADKQEKANAVLQEWRRIT